MAEHLLLTFPETRATEPVIYRIVTDFDVVPNIRRAAIENHLGWMVIELDGDPDRHPQGQGVPDRAGHRGRARRGRHRRGLTGDPRPAHAARRDRCRPHRHGDRGHDRHARTAAGQAAARPVLPRPGGRARHRGLQLPAGRRRGHEHRRRLSHGLMAQRLRRLRHAARLRLVAVHPMAPRHRDGAGRRPVGGRNRRARQPPPGAQGAIGATGRCRAAGLRRHRARVHHVRRLLRAGVVAGLPGPDPGQPVQRRLLDPRDLPHRAAAAPHPAGHGRCGHVRRERQGRVQPRTARDRLQVRRCADRLRRPRGLQDRRQGDRLPRGYGDHLHGQVRPARRQLLPYPPVPARRRRGAGPGRRGRPGRAFRGGQVVHRRADRPHA